MTNREPEQFKAFVRQLQQEATRHDTLTEIKNLLVYKPANEAATEIREAGITNIMQCLYSQDKTHVDLTCEVLRMCFEKFDVGEAVKYFVPYMMYLLRHEKSCVRQLAIEQVHTAVMKDPNLLPYPQYIDVFVATAQMVCDEDVGIANKAIQITSNLPLAAYPKVLEEMKIALDYNSSSKCNAFEVVINISSKSNELFTLCENHGYIDQMLSELNTNDVLYQLNILELLSRLAVKPHGITYLIKQGTLQRIASLVEEIKDQPLAGVLIPGYMKFFGAVAHHYPREMFNKYPILLDAMFDALDSGDMTILPVALDTLGFIGITIEGKLCLASLGSKFTQGIEKVAQLIRNSPAELKVRALYCFSSLISYDKDPNAPRVGPIDHRATLMSREWFRTLDAKPMEKLCEMCKNPFPDIRLAAFSLLDAVCQHQWGEELVARTAGFVEYLLDRSTDHTKESKEIKFDIIRRLSYSMSFDANTIQRLTNYVLEGPFYYETSLEVAMEGDD